MVPWIFVHNPLEPWLEDYRKTFDAWEDGGVRGIVVGRMWFVQEDGNGIPLWGDILTPSFPADPKAYASFGINPPPETPRNLEKEKQLNALLDNAASRFHPDPDLGAPEWSVISGLCGNQWQQSPEGYWPSDTPKPDAFSRT